MNALGIIKGTAEIVVNVAVGGIVGNVITLTVGPEAKLPRRILTGIGGYVLAVMIGSQAEKYVDHAIDNVYTGIKRAVGEAKIGVSISDDEIQDFIDDEDNNKKEDSE